MARTTLSRRDFMKMMGVSAASAAAWGNFSKAGRAFAAPRPQDITNISFMGWGDVQEDEGVQAAIEVFHAEQDAIRITWMHTPDNYNEKLLSNVAAGTPPDTAFISYSQYRTLIHDGLTMDITELVENDPLLGQEDYFVQPQEIERSTDGNGRWHGIGSCWTANHLFFNQELFEEAGVEPPDFDDDKIWDWDTFLEAARLLTKDANGRHPGDAGFDVENVTQWGFYMGADWWMNYDQLARFNGGQMSDGQLLTLDTPEAIAGIQAFTDLIHVHQVMPEAVFFNELGMSATQMLDTRRLAMVVDGSWALSYMYEVGSLGVGPIPVMTPEGRASGQGHPHAILQGTQNVEAAWEWLRFLATPFYESHFCKLGLWIPNQTAMLTEAGIDSWITEGIHPPNYRKFVADYVPKHMSPTLVPAGFPQASSIFLPALERVLNGEGPAAELMPPAVAQANEVILDTYGSA
ncbi:MAG: extracellular solute-binding protein [Anaerolineae bacterium]|nr:extracellular solute-binding protein [Anaerolineae bacterium]